VYRLTSCLTHTTENPILAVLCASVSVAAVCWQQSCTDPFCDV